MPPEAEAARTALLALEPPEKKNPGSGTDVPITDDGLRLLSAWGSFSIHTELSAGDGTVILVAHDEAWLSARFTAAEVDAVKARLAEQHLDLAWHLPDARPSWWQRVTRRT